jgi:hypothetical protein
VRSPSCGSTRGQPVRSPSCGSARRGRVRKGASAKGGGFAHPRVVQHEGGGSTCWPGCHRRRVIGEGPRLSSLGPTHCPRVVVCHLVFVRHWSHSWSLRHTRMVVGSSFRWLVVAGFRAEWRSLCRSSLRRWSVGWHERGMATNHDKCRGSCFYDAPNGPPTPGSPLPLFPNPYSSVGKV